MKFTCKTASLRAKLGACPQNSKLVCKTFSLQNFKFARKLRVCPQIPARLQKPKSLSSIAKLEARPQNLMFAHKNSELRLQKSKFACTTGSLPTTAHIRMPTSEFAAKLGHGVQSPELACETESSLAQARARPQIFELARKTPSYFAKLKVRLQTNEVAHNTPRSPQNSKFATQFRVRPQNSELACKTVSVRA